MGFLHFKQMRVFVGYFFALFLRGQSVDRSREDFQGQYKVEQQREACGASKRGLVCLAQALDMIHDLKCRRARCRYALTVQFLISSTETRKT